MRFFDALEIFIKTEVELAGLSPKTVEGYRNFSKLVIGFYGADALVENVTLESVADFHAHLLTWQSRDTARGNLLSFRKFLKYTNRRGWTKIDADSIRVPRREKKLVGWMDFNEVERFIDEVGRPVRGYSAYNRLRNVAMVRVLWASGIRVSELCALNRGDIKDRQFAVVGKSKQPRVCFIDRKAEAALNAYLAKRQDYGRALFVDRNGERVTPGGVRNVFKAACARSEFEGVHPHTLRHSFATFMLRQDVDLRYIGAMLGHESLDTTKIYTHFANPELRRIYEKAQKNY